MPEPPAEEPGGAYGENMGVGETERREPEPSAGAPGPPVVDQGDGAPPEGAPAGPGPSEGDPEAPGPGPSEGDPVEPAAASGPDRPGRYWEDVDRGAVPEVPAEWREAVYDGSSKWGRAELFADDREMAVEEYVDAVNEHTRELLADGRLCMFVPPAALRSVVLGGRFKNQHETGTSRGFKGRGPFEERMMGADPEDDPTSAPVYGIVAADPESEGLAYLRGHYGNTVVVFRDQLRPRTTFTVGDSLDENIVAGPTTWLAPVNDPDEGAQLYGPDDPLDVVDVDDLSPSSYVEAQYWGPVTLDDVEVVYVDEPGLALQLRNAGVEAREFPY